MGAVRPLLAGVAGLSAFMALAVAAPAAHAAPAQQQRPTYTCEEVLSFLRGVDWNDAAFYDLTGRKCSASGGAREKGLIWFTVHVEELGSGTRWECSGGGRADLPDELHVTFCRLSS